MKQKTKLKLDISLYEMGMPCHKYILRNLHDNSQALTFLKMFVNTLSSIGLPDQTISRSIELLNVTLSEKSALQTCDFTQLAIPLTGVSIIDRIRMDDSVASYRRCTQYYKSICKSQTLCQLCPLSGNYKNNNAWYEAQILRYCIESKDNLLYVQTLGISDKHFKGLDDLFTYSAYAKKPYLYPFNAHTYKALSTPSISDLLFVESNVSSFQEAFFAYHEHYINKGIPLDEWNVANNIILQTAGVFWDSIQEKELETKEKINAYAKILLEETPQDANYSHTVISSHSNLGPEEIDAFYSEIEVDMPCKDKKQKISATHSKPIQKKENRETRHIIHNETNGELLIKELPPVPPPYELFIKNNAETMIGLPFISMEERNHFCLSLDHSGPRLQTILESSSLKERRICIELILSENNKRFLLIYVPRLHAYLYTDFSNIKSKELITRLLQYPSIEKYCYYPFELAASFRKMGIYINNLLSLFSLSACLYPSHHMEMEQVLELMGGKKAIGGLTIRPVGEINSLPILYMHDYISIYKRHCRCLIANGIMEAYRFRNHLDFILAGSYKLELCCQQKGYLFQLIDSDTYQFTDSCSGDYKYEGIILSYHFHHVSEREQITGHLLCTMEQNGLFKKYPMTVLYYSGRSMRLYVPASDFALIYTKIHTLILLYIREHDLSNVTYDISQQCPESILIT